MIAATVAKTADIDPLWDKVYPDIVKCIARTPTFFTAADLWTMCRSGAAFLIIIHEETTILGSAIWRFEDGNYVCLMLTGRRSDEWISILYERARYEAKRGGAKQLMASGRLGLFRKLKKHLAGVRMIRITVAVEV